MSGTAVSAVDHGGDHRATFNASVIDPAILNVKLAEKLGTARKATLRAEGSMGFQLVRGDFNQQFIRNASTAWKTFVLRI